MFGRSFCGLIHWLRLPVRIRRCRKVTGYRSCHSYARCLGWKVSQFMLPLALQLFKPDLDIVWSYDCIITIDSRGVGASQVSSGDAPSDVLSVPGVSLASKKHLRKPVSPTLKTRRLPEGHEGMRSSLWAENRAGSRAHSCVSSCADRETVSPLQGFPVTVQTCLGPRYSQRHIPIGSIGFNNCVSSRPEELLVF